jgi:hypothetical protein
MFCQGSQFSGNCNNAHYLEVQMIVACAGVVIDLGHHGQPMGFRPNKMFHLVKTEVEVALFRRPCREKCVERFS